MTDNYQSLKMYENNDLENNLSVSTENIIVETFNPMLHNDNSTQPSCPPYPLEAYQLKTYPLEIYPLPLEITQPNTTQPNTIQQNTIQPNTIKTNTTHNTKLNNIKKYFEKLCFALFVCLIILYIVCIIMNVCYLLVILIKKPTKMNYCHNKHKMCDYYSTEAILYNNTINEIFYDFEVKYKLESSYKYIIGNVNKTCDNLESYDFDSYDDALMFSKNSTGTIKNIYVPFDDTKKCKLSYMVYNPYFYTLQKITIYNCTWLIPLIIFAYIKHYIDKQSCGLVTWKNLLAAMLYDICKGIHIVSELLFGYYLMQYIIFKNS